MSCTGRPSPAADESGELLRFVNLLRHRSDPPSPATVPGLLFLAGAGHFLNTEAVDRPSERSRATSSELSWLSAGQQAAIVASAQDWANAQTRGGDRGNQHGPSQSQAVDFDSVAKRSIWRKSRHPNEGRQGGKGQPGDRLKIQPTITGSELSCRSTRPAPSSAL